MKKLIKLETYLLILLVIVLLINLYLIISINTEYSKKLAEAKEASRPAEIEITIINTQCPDCFDINTIINDLKSKNTNITKQTRLSKEEATDLIKKYSITKLPSLIVEGEIDKFNLGLEKRDNILLFNNPEPPYYDLITNSVLGRVSLTLINDPTCIKCTDLSVVVDQFKQLMAITNEETLTKEQSSNLIEKYNIKKIPTIILSKDAFLYDNIINSWTQIGTIESDGSLIVRDINPPYIDTTTNEIKGLVKSTYINDKTCKECYNVTAHKQVLENFGIYIDQEETKDITDSTLLISKYNIKKIPTIILSKEVAEYPRLTAVWKDVGTIEDDGVYIFRKTELMGISKDLNTNSLIKTT